MRTALASLLAAAVASPAGAQTQDFSKVEIGVEKVAGSVYVGNRGRCSDLSNCQILLHRRWGLPGLPLENLTIRKI